MNIQLVIERQKTGARTVELLPSQEVCDFIFNVAETFEKQAFKLYDEVERLIKEGEIDQTVTVAQEAKRLNDTYLDVYRAAEEMERRLPVEESA